MQSNMAHSPEPKSTVFIPYELLPESHNWKPGETYRIKAVLKQINTGIDGATFEVMDATSLEVSDRGMLGRHYMSDEGMYKGK